ncbi:MAG TPA: hypothetical protein VEZ88_13600 [Steroidobacteraceae bacterium]|nr:hypothetical protein [Steroidobacteraceae bacterium]
MSNFTKSGFRSTVSAAAAVTITAMIAWSMYSYAGYLERNSGPSLSTAQIESSTETLNTQNG